MFIVTRFVQNIFVEVQYFLENIELLQIKGICYDIQWFDQYATTVTDFTAETSLHDK